MVFVPFIIFSAIIFFIPFLERFVSNSLDNLKIKKNANDTLFSPNSYIEKHEHSKKESFITISSPLYTATITNRSGGSFVNYVLKNSE